MLSYVEMNKLLNNIDKIVDSLAEIAEATQNIAFNLAPKEDE